MLRRGIPGQVGYQTFFNEAGRAFCLYVVLGNGSERAPARRAGELRARDRPDHAAGGRVGSAQMGAWAGPFLVAALLLTVAGALKACDPRNTVGALRKAGLPVRTGPRPGRWCGRGGDRRRRDRHRRADWRLHSSRSRTSLFTAFVVYALVRHLPIGSCGCFGKVDTPPSVVHVVLNLGAIVAATAVAVRGGGGIGDVLADQELLGLPVPPLRRHRDLPGVPRADPAAAAAEPRVSASRGGRFVSQKLAERAAKLLGRKGTSRRSFLQKTAIVGSAVAVVPKDFLLRPTSAYAALCNCSGRAARAGRSAATATPSSAAR